MKVPSSESPVIVIANFTRLLAIVPQSSSPNAFSVLMTTPEIALPLIERRDRQGVGVNLSE